MKRPASILFTILALAFAAVGEDDIYPKKVELPDHFPKHLTDPPLGQKQFLRWCAFLYGFRPYDARLHAIVRRADTTFVLFTMRHTTVHNTNYSVGITWMALRAGTIVECQAQKLDDTWRPISGSIEGWGHGVLSWGAEGMFVRDGELVDEGYSAFFDPKSPDKGIQMKETYKLPLK